MDKVPSTQDLEDEIKKYSCPSNYMQNEKMERMSVTEQGTEFVHKLLKEEEQCLWNCLPNELLIYIFKYVPHTDLRKVRAVCKRWHYITRLREFMEKSKLILNANNVATLLKCLHNGEEFSTRVNYNTVEIEGLEASNDLCFILKALCQNVRNVYLDNSPVFSILNTCTPQMRELNVIKMRHFNRRTTVDTNFSTFKNLKSLDILIIRNKNLINSLLLKLMDRSLKMENLSLTVFRGQEQLIIDTLRYHSQSLKYLKIKFRFYSILTTQQCEVFALFQHLESLDIHCGNWLKEIMECLPRDINLRYLHIWSGALDDLLFKQIIRKWQRSLQNIKLNCCDNITDDGVKDLSMLRLNLRHLAFVNCRNISPKGVLQGVAEERNTILQALTLAFMHSTDWISMMLLFQSLPHLTYLSLEACNECVNDYTLASIIATQLKLQHLSLECCDFITDEGVLGFGANLAPITKLKGLQTLSLWRCNKLSNCVPLQYFKFYELRKLKFAYRNEVNTIEIEELMRNCPALKELSIVYRNADGDFLRIFQNLPRLKRLYVWEYDQITLESIDEQMIRKYMCIGHTPIRFCFGE